MEEKARLTVLIDPARKKAFEELCASQDVTASQMVRLLIRQYREKHGIQLELAGKSPLPVRVRLGYPRQRK